MSAMPTFAEIKKAISDIATAFEAFKETNDERIKALAEGNGSKASELDDKLARIEKSISQYVDLRKTLELDMKLQRERL